MPRKNSENEGRADGGTYRIDSTNVELSPGGTKTVDVNMMGLMYGKRRKSSKNESKNDDEEYNVTLPDNAFPLRF